MIISMSTQCLCSKRSRIHEKRMLDIYQIQHPLTSARLILILSLQTELLIPSENPYTCLCVSTTSPNHTSQQVSLPSFKPAAAILLPPRLHPLHPACLLLWSYTFNASAPWRFTVTPNQKNIFLSVYCEVNTAP